MNEWRLFTYLFGQVQGPFDHLVQGIINGLVGYLTTPLLVIIAVYLAGMTAVELYRPDGNLGINTVRRLFRAALVFAVVSNAAIYNHYVTDFLLNTVPMEVSNAVSNGAANGQPIDAVAFDRLLVGAWEATNYIYKTAPSLSLRGLFIMGLAGVYIIAAACALLVAFLVFIATHLLLALLIATGPAFVVLFLFPRTEGFFNGWIAGCASMIVTQVFVVALLTFMLGVEREIIHQVATTVEQHAARQDLNALLLLIESGIVYAMGALLAMQLAGIARGIMGGVSHNVAPYTRAVHSALGGTARLAGSTAATAGNAAGGAARAGTSVIRRNLIPPGRAL